MLAVLVVVLRILKVVVLVLVSGMNADYGYYWKIWK